MENYIVSARKYRPQTFDTVVGQQALTQALQNAINQNHLAHAYLFCGPRGVGKTTCARIFARTINNNEPGSEWNIHELDAASNNSVEDIKSILDQVRIPPQAGKYSVYIIDEVHMLSTAAFNALLKTLEEPPSYAIFILATTEKHKVIPTILSRCQVYDFNRITVPDTIAYLQKVAANEGVTADEEALNVVAQKADGGMRDALSIFDQLVAFCGSNITYERTIEVLNVLNADYYFSLVEHALRHDPHSTSSIPAISITARRVTNDSPSNSRSSNSANSVSPRSFRQPSLHNLPSRSRMSRKPSMSSLHNLPSRSSLSRLLRRSPLLPSPRCRASTSVWARRKKSQSPIFNLQSPILFRKKSPTALLRLTNSETRGLVWLPFIRTNRV